MDKGSSGRSVSEVQSLLVKLSYVITGGELSLFTFGSDTDYAVRRFQADRNLLVDGIVGPQTINTLRAAVAKISRKEDSNVTEVLSHVEGPEEKIEALLKATGIEERAADGWGQAIHDAIAGTPIETSDAQLASFLANMLHESGHLKTLEENLNYSDTALLKLFKRHFTPEEARKYGRTPGKAADQQSIANKAYGNRYGNGDFNSGDGWKFRGGGPFQLTFHDNYKAFGDYAGMVFTDKPDEVRTQKYGAKSAVWFWVTNKCGPLAEAGDLSAVCKRINGGSNGVNERADLTEFLLKHITGTK